MQVLVNLGKLLEGEEESKKDDIVKGLHDESGSLYSDIGSEIKIIDVESCRIKQRGRIRGGRSQVEGEDQEQKEFYGK